MRPTCALLLLLALAPAACAAAPAASGATSPAPAASREAAAALMAMPAPPKNYSVDMKIHADGKDITMTRATNENGDLRMDIQMPERGSMTMIQLNDEKQTMYTVMDDRKEVMKQSRAAMLERAGKHEEKDAAPDSAKEGEGTVEKVGQEEVNGVLADKYKVTAEGMAGMLWVDPKTGLIARMQAENGSVDFTNYKIGAVTPALLTPPKDYKLTDMDEMMAKMGGMGGMAKGMMGGMLGGMGAGMGGNLGGAAGGALGGMIGGPLGRMAGQYLGNKLGSKIGSKVGQGAASKL